MTLLATWFASLATLISFLAFAFDIAVFTVAKYKIQDATKNTDEVSIKTSVGYGAAIWLTLAGFLVFAFSGCAFRVGRRIARAKTAAWVAGNAFKPRVDDNYAANQRGNARMAEQRRHESVATLDKDEEGLPYFAEPEAVPLRSYNDRTDAGDIGMGHAQEPTSSSTGYDRNAIDGVGTGYGRRTPHAYQDSVSGPQHYQQDEAQETVDAFAHTRVGSQPVRKM